MPPKKRAPKACGLCFTGAIICFSGTLSKDRKSLEASVAANGGKYVASVTKACTHLVTTVSDFEGRSSKVRNNLGITLGNPAQLPR